MAEGILKLKRRAASTMARYEECAGALSPAIKMQVLDQLRNAQEAAARGSRRRLRIGMENDMHKALAALDVADALLA